jgi:hypothetical protein
MQEPEVWQLLERLSVIAKKHDTRSAVLLVIWKIRVQPLGRVGFQRTSEHCQQSEAQQEDVLSQQMCRLLCEVHEDFQLNVTLAAHGYWVGTHGLSCTTQLTGHLFDGRVYLSAHACWLFEVYGSTDAPIHT